MRCYGKVIKLIVVFRLWARWHVIKILVLSFLVLLMLIYKGNFVKDRVLISKHFIPFCPLSLSLLTYTHPLPLPPFPPSSLHEISLLRGRCVLRSNLSLLKLARPFGSRVPLTRQGFWAKAPH